MRILVVLIIVSMLALVSCEQQEEQHELCPLARITMGVLSDKFVESLGTCSASKMANVVLKQMHCEAQYPVLTAESRDRNVLKSVCPVAIDILGELVGLYGYATLDCDESIIQNKIIGLQLCEQL